MVLAHINCQPFSIWLTFGRGSHQLRSTVQLSFAAERAAISLNLRPRDLAAWSILLQQWRLLNGRGRPVATAGGSGMDFAAAMDVSLHVKCALGPAGASQALPSTSSNVVLGDTMQRFAECMSGASPLSSLFSWNDHSYQTFSELKSKMLLGHVEGLSDQELVTCEFP
jgi:hypothetical protein